LFNLVHGDRTVGTHAGNTKQSMTSPSCQKRTDISERYGPPEGSR
jgi:hypothetical protein